MPALNRRRGGFTLVELIISIALGAVVVGVAFAGLRAAAVAFAAGGRLATENALLRAGFTAALDELDFWRACDDPATGRTALRAVDRPYDANHPLADGLGLPFTPMSDIWDDSANLPGRWDPRAEAWAAPTPAARWAGNSAECADTDVRFGRYALFFDQYDALNIPAYSHHNVSLPAYGAVTPSQTWWCQQFRGLASVLGTYGLMDYLPANSLDAYYGRFFLAPPRGAFGEADIATFPSAGGIPSEWLIGGHGGNGNWGVKWKMHPWVDSNRTPRSRYRATLACAFPLVVAPAFTATWASRQPRNVLYDDGGAVDLGRFMDETSARPEPMPLSPSTWPMVRTAVMRYVLVGRFYNLCVVRMNDPLNGNALQLTFNSFGTTLRGARQQRGLDLRTGGP